MKLGFSQQEIIGTAKSLGLPTDGFIQRRVARAFDLVETDKVNVIDDGIFRVRSQYDPSKAYIVNLNGDWGCDCPDHQKNTGATCKHMIASMIFAQNHEAKPNVKVTYDDTANSYRRLGRWWVTDYTKKTHYQVFRDVDGSFACCCGSGKDCTHKQAVREYLNNNGGNGRGLPQSVYGSKPTTECGTSLASAIQAKLNGQLNSRSTNGNGAYCAPSQPQLEIRNPFQECELKDIAQIEGRSNGDLVWTLRNGETVISYKGIMTLAEKHGISFSVSHHEDTNTVIAYARRDENRSERISGKPVRVSGSILTASELAKRNAARQLIPFAEIKVLELKAKLEADFSWEKAKAKCVQLVGTEANVDIIIHELVQAGNLRQDNPSHYNRIEWLIIHNACKEDAQSNDNNDGGDNSPPSSEARDPKSLNRWSYNSDAFIEKCREAIEKVRNGKVVEAAEMPLENGNGKRKLQMDKKLRTWLIDSNGTRKAISCREICEKFESNIVTRLRAGIDSGADLSTVELDD